MRGLRGQNNSSPALGDAVQLFTFSRFLSWCTKSIVALLDQGFTSASGFCVNFLLARWLSPQRYGAFAVSFAAFLMLAGFHNVLLLEPLSVFGPARYPTRLPEYFRAQIRVHVALVGAVSLLIVPVLFILLKIAPKNPLIGALAGCSVAMPLLLLLWLARRMCYAAQKPTIAVAGSFAYFALVIAGLTLLKFIGSVSSFWAFVLMGCSGALAAGLLLFLLRVLGRTDLMHESVPWTAVLHENWLYGRWLVGSAALYSVANQAQMFLIPVFLSLGAAGVLRAMQLPSLIMTQVIAAIGLMILPAFSRDFGRGAIQRLRQKALFASFAMVVIALIFWICLAGFADRIEHILFAGKYHSYAWLIPVLALVPAARALSVGFSMALRAMQKPQFDLISNAIAAPVCVLSVVLFTRWWGLAGVAASMILTAATMSFVAGVFFLRQGQIEVRS